MEDEHMIPKSRFDEINQKLKDAQRELEGLEALKQKADQAAKLQETLEKQKSTIDEMAAQLKTQTEIAQTKDKDLTRLQVAYEQGIPFHLADRLRGENPEELKSDAASLLQYVKPTTPGAPPPPAPGPVEPGVTEEKLNDPKWVRENKDLVMQHYSQG